MNEQAIFLAALNIADPAERAAYLNRTCAIDPTLRRQVEALLAAHVRSGEFLDVPALQQIAAHHEKDWRSPAETGAELPGIKRDIDLTFLQPSTKLGSLGRLRHYEIEEVIGQGGCGIVLKAFDEMLHRMVAIKVMAPELAATSPARKRFLREARAAAAIRHDNVVNIHSVEEQPIPFLVMEHIAGQTLQQKLDQTGPLDVREVLRTGHQIASGLQAAHAMGLIHRDIKPGNILLEKSGDRVKITDFGLARATDDASLTQSGMIAGTPLYMSPEQAQGDVIDQRSDLFSLGSVLYVMCSGRPPFRAPTTLAVLKRVVEDEPRPIQQIIPEAPEWLCAIIARLHAKNPEDRLASAEETANLLARCLSDLQQHGRVKSLGDVWPTAPKPPCAPPLVHAIGGEGQEATGESKRIRPLLSRPRWVAAAAVLLVLVAGLGLTEATGVTNFQGAVIRLLSPDGTLLVEVDDPGVSVNIDGEEMVITGAGAQEIRLKPGQYKVLASKDGKIVRQELVTVTRNGRQVVRVSKEAESAKAAIAKPVDEKWLREVAALPIDPKLRQSYKTLPGEWKVDGDELVQETHFSECRLVFGDFAWKDYDFSCEAKLTDPRNMQINLLYRVTGAGGNEFVLGGWNNTSDRVRAFNQGKLVEFRRRDRIMEPDRWYKLAVRVRGVHGKCFVDDQWVFDYEDSLNPCGAIGFCTESGTARFRNIRVSDPAGKILFEGLPQLPATADQWLPATAPASASELLCLKRHGGSIIDATFSPDGRQVVSVSDGRSWGDKVGGGEGKNVVNLSSASTLRLWDAETGKELDRSSIRPSPWLPAKLTWSPGSSRFITAFSEANPPSFDLGIRVWGIEGEKLKSELLFPDKFGGALSLGFTPDGRKIFSVNNDGQLREWDVKNKVLSRHLLGALQKVAQGTCVAIAPDGRAALVPRQDQAFAEIDLSTGKQTGRWQGLTYVQSLTFSPDGASVLTGSVDGTLSLWDVTNAKFLHVLGSHQGRVKAVAISPDGKRALSGGEDWMVRLWDLEAKQELACFTGHTGAISSVAFSPDGTRAVSGSGDYTVRVWQLPPLAHRVGWVEEKWLREVAALPAEQQVAAAAEKIKERNHGFDGKLNPKIANGIVVELELTKSLSENLGGS